MEKITLKVTSGCMNHAIEQGEVKWNQTQIAIVHPRFDASSAKRINIAIGGIISLEIGDTHAIWHSHNETTKHQSKNFKRLFSLLANNPDQEMQFLYNPIKL